jgi:iron complex outermembrane recepter protein
MFFNRFFAGVAILLCFCQTVIRANYQLEEPDLTEFSLAELMNLDVVVTLPARREQKLSQSASAIYVMTREDIRRSGATRITEALRMVPGFDIAMHNSSTWAVSSRGFTDVFSNKLLVMIHGRSIYTPHFSGVFWQNQDVVLEDVERIEVIRGPGASLYGSNAVNGVINIITRPACETQGEYLELGSGDQQPYSLIYRRGSKLSEKVFSRIYVKTSQMNPLVTPQGLDAIDRWNAKQTGFRIDWDLTPKDHFTLQGDYFRNSFFDIGQHFLGQPFSTPIVPGAIPFHAGQSVNRNDLHQGTNLLARLEHEGKEGAGWSLKLYQDRFKLEGKVFTSLHDTFDFDFQRSFKRHKKHQLMWGVNYRLIRDVIPPAQIIYDPVSREVENYSAFFQDEIQMSPKFRFILGSKFEDSYFGGRENQPSLKFLYSPENSHTWWGSVARAARTPSRTEREGSGTIAELAGNPLIPLLVPTLVTLEGSPKFQSEHLTAWELGYRYQRKGSFTLDTTAFYFDYDDLRSSEPQPGVNRAFLGGLPGSYTFAPIRLGNKISGSSKGVELFADWKLSDRTRIKASYSYIDLDFKLHSSSRGHSSQAGQSNRVAEGFATALNLVSLQGDAPAHQASILLSRSLSPREEFDCMLRYVDDRKSTQVPDYLALDLQYSYQTGNQWSITLIGKNLLDPSHLESGLNNNPLFSVTEVPRSFYLKLSRNF